MTDDLQPLSPSDGVQRFLDHRAPSLRESSMENARHRMSVFLEWCTDAGVENLNDLRGRDLAAFVAWRQDDVAPITLQKQLSSVRQALRYWADIEAVREGLAEKLHAPELPDGAERATDVLDESRAEHILEHLGRYEYASRRHALFVLLWRTGMRRSAARSLDLDDLRPDDCALVLEHRPETGTKLKNGENGERWVYLGPRWYEIVAEYVDANRKDVTDQFGREPLLTTRYGRPTGDTIYNWVTQLTHELGPCGSDCLANGDEPASRCPESVGPHALRRGAITHHLKEGTAAEVCSERMDVSLEVLYQHYDARNERERMDVRRNQLPE